MQGLDKLFIASYTEMCLVKYTKKNCSLELAMVLDSPCEI